MNRLLRVLAATCVVCIGANGDIIASFELPGAEHTSRADVVEETFESRPVGALGAYSSPIGQYTDGGERVKAFDIYGSSNKYLEVGLYGLGTVTPFPYTYELSFTADLNYFGLFWAAVDGDDTLSFYSGTTLVKSFDKTLFAGLSSSYYVLNGAETPPTTKEPYAFVNFDGTSGSNFNRIVFSNGGNGTGFETDNHTILDDSFVFVDGSPEPGTLGLAGVSLALLVYKLRKRSVPAPPPVN